MTNKTLTITIEENFPDGKGHSAKKVFDAAGFSQLHPMDAGAGLLTIVAQLNAELAGVAQEQRADEQMDRAVNSDQPPKPTPALRVKPDDENPTFKKPKLKEYKKSAPAPVP